MRGEHQTCHRTDTQVEGSLVAELRAAAGAAARPGRREASLVERGGLVGEDVGQDNVDAPVEIAAGEVAGILDADALLQLSSLPYHGAAWPTTTR